MKPHEIKNDIFVVGGPEITDGRDGCVGHFGIYSKTKKEVREYILSYRRQYGVE